MLNKQEKKTPLRKATFPKESQVQSVLELEGPRVENAHAEDLGQAGVHGRRAPSWQKNRLLKKPLDRSIPNGTAATERTGALEWVLILKRLLENRDGHKIRDSINLQEA